MTADITLPPATKSPRTITLPIATDEELAAVVPGAWTAPTFLNGWINFGAPYAPAAYRKVGDIVFLRGLLKGGAFGAAAFQLPAGFRAPYDLFFAVPNNDQYGSLAVTAAGNVQPNSPPSTTWVDLAGVQFSITT